MQFTCYTSLHFNPTWAENRSGLLSLCSAGRQVEKAVMNWLPFVALAVVYGATQFAAKLKAPSNPPPPPSLPNPKVAVHVRQHEYAPSKAGQRSILATARPPPQACSISPQHSLLGRSAAGGLGSRTVVCIWRGPPGGVCDPSTPWRLGGHVPCCRCGCGAEARGWRVRQGDAEDRKKLRAAENAKVKQMDQERDVDARIIEAEEMANMGVRCARLRPPPRRAGTSSRPGLDASDSQAPQIKDNHRSGFRTDHHAATNDNHESAISTDHHAAATVHVSHSSSCRQLRWV